MRPGATPPEPLLPMLRLLLRALLLAALSGTAHTGAWADELGDIQRLQTAGDLSGALARTDAALSLQPRDAPLRFLRGVLLAELKRDGEALDQFQRMHEDYPELPDPLNNIAVLHAARGELEAARVALVGALRNDPQHRAARENLADVYLRLALGLWDGLARSGPADLALTHKLRLARELLRAPG